MKKLLLLSLSIICTTSPSERWEIESKIQKIICGYKEDTNNGKTLVFDLNGSHYVSKNMPQTEGRLFKNQNNKNEYKLVLDEAVSYYLTLSNKDSNISTFYINKIE